ncbi:hypothetical protein PM082_020609 [Marasmius tenuissimus]|nr:hypothetical protein PM082_020609 [Marasmius tenuissimus]
MSGVEDANWAAAQSLGLDETTTSVLATGLGLIHVLQVYTSCMVALATWDWIVCLKLEWEHIWKREWSLVKFLYIWTRYYGLLAFALNLWLFNGNFTAEQCKPLHYFIAATCMWVTLGSEAILAVRTYAFLGKGKIIGGILLTMLLAETGFLLFVSIAAHIVSGFWLAPVAFDLVCTFLTFYKALQLQTIGAKNPIVKTFIREGLGYFLAVAFVNVLNAAFMFQSNANIQNINCFLALVLSQVLCCRLVLNLRASRNNGTTAANFSSNSASHHAFQSAPPLRGTQNGTINIPLNRLANQEPYGNEDVYGVKVQVDVESHQDKPKNMH